MEEGTPKVGWYESALPTALATGRPGSVVYEDISASFIIVVGRSDETYVD